MLEIWTVSFLLPPRKKWGGGKKLLLFLSASSSSFTPVDFLAVLNQETQTHSNAWWGQTHEASHTLIGVLFDDIIMTFPGSQ